MVALITLWRHAKSDWTKDGLPDHERTLNPRGRWAAPLMAAEILSQLPPIDQIYCSSSMRTRQTAAALLEQAPTLADHITYADEAYHAPAADIIAYAQAIPEERHYLWIGHDPGITAAANYFAGDTIDRMATATWAHCLVADRILIAFHQPPRYQP